LVITNFTNVESLRKEDKVGSNRFWLLWFFLSRFFDELRDKFVWFILLVLLKQPASPMKKLQHENRNIIEMKIYLLIRRLHDNKSG
jgi:hypothetical protein